MEKPQVTVLDNGLKVVTQQTPGEEQTLANISVHVGSRYEEPQEAGMCHFLEHMLASDTEKLSKDEKSIRIKKMEGATNASTGFEVTQYYIHADGPHTEETISMLADGIVRPLMDPTRIEKERGAITAEIKGRLDDPQTKMLFDLLGTAYSGSSLGHYIGGTPETVAEITREQLIDFKNHHYTADNMVLTVVGDVDHDEIVSYAKKHLGEIAPSSPEHDLSLPTTSYRGGYKVTPNDQMNQLTFSMAFEGSPESDIKGHLEETILASILGGDQSTRLMKKLRGEEGLVYYASCFPQSLSDTSAFVVMAGFDAVNGEKAIKGACEELSKAAKDLTEEEFDIAKSSLLGRVKRSKNDVGNIAGGLIQSMNTHERPVTTEEELEVLQSITLDDLKARSAKIFSTAPSVSAVGKDADKLPPYEQISEWMGNRRELDASGLVKENAPNADRTVAEAELAAKPARSQSREIA